jgi:hypothetical protein
MEVDLNLTREQAENIRPIIEGQVKRRRGLIQKFQDQGESWLNKGANQCVKAGEEVREVRNPVLREQGFSPLKQSYGVMLVNNVPCLRKAALQS